MGKIYLGRRVEGKIVVYVDGQQLLPDESQKVYNHSPTGFEIGYRGSGPHQLALAILLDFTGNEKTALRYYRFFVIDFVFDFPQNGFVLTGSDLAIWLNKKIFKDKLGQAE